MTVTALRVYRSHRVERLDEPGAVDLRQTHFDAAGRERTVGILLAGGGLVDEHQDLRGIRLDLRDRGPRHGRRRLDGFLGGGRRDDLFGELCVVGKEVTGEADLAAAKSWSSDSGEYDSSAIVPVVAASSATFAAAASVCSSGRYWLTYSQPASPAEPSRAAASRMALTLKRVPRHALRGRSPTAASAFRAPSTDPASSDSSTAASSPATVAASASLSFRCLHRSRDELDFRHLDLVTFALQIHAESPRPGLLVGTLGVGDAGGRRDEHNRRILGHRFHGHRVHRDLGDDLEARATSTKSVACCSKSVLNWPVELSMMRCTSSCAWLKSSDINVTTLCRPAAVYSASNCYSSTA